jgi:hypothetical protein
LGLILLDFRNYNVQQEQTDNKWTLITLIFDSSNAVLGVTLKSLGKAYETFVLDKTKFVPFRNPKNNIALGSRKLSKSHKKTIFPLT